MDCESLGHHVGLPFDPVIPAIEHPLLPKGTIVELGGGENPYQHVEQQNKVWSETVRFIDKIFSKNLWLKIHPTKIGKLTIDESVQATTALPETTGLADKLSEKNDHFREKK